MPVMEKYDYIIIDTPPALNLLTVNAYVVSDFLIIPMASDILSLVGLSQLKETIESVQENLNPELKDVYKRQMMRLSLPFLIISMAVGVLVAIFQAATQINEQTITFVPKLLAILGLLGVLGSSMLVMLQDFIRTIFEIIAGG